MARREPGAAAARGEEDDLAVSRLRIGFPAPGGENRLWYEICLYIKGTPPLLNIVACQGQRTKEYLV